MSDHSDLAFRSLDDRFNVVISNSALQAIIDECAQAGRKETGGILIGRIDPSGDTAVVIEATPKPKGSGFGLFWFKRSPTGLKQLLAERWNRGQHYLGEWHFHPGGSPEPSGSDYHTMEKIAADQRYQAHEPILIIMGGKTENTTIKTLMEITGQTKEDVSSVLQKFGGDEDLAVSELMSSACFFFLLFFLPRKRVRFFWTTEIETNAALQRGFRDATDRWLLRDCSAQVCGRQNEKE